MENEVEKNSLEEIFKKEVAKNKKELTKEEIKKLTEEARESIDFLKKIDEIELPKDKYVIFTDGEEQLFYENGEFYIISTTDSTKTKKKKTKKEATDLYLNFFIKYQLNPILDLRNRKERNIEQKQKETKQKIAMAKKTLGIDKKKETQSKAKEEKSQQKDSQKKIEKDDISL